MGSRPRCRGCRVSLFLLDDEEREVARARARRDQCYIDLSTMHCLTHCSDVRSWVWYGDHLKIGHGPACQWREAHPRKRGQRKCRTMRSKAKVRV